MKKNKNKKGKKLLFSSSQDLILIPTSIPFDSLFKLYDAIKDILFYQNGKNNIEEKTLFVINEIKDIPFFSKNLNTKNEICEKDIYMESNSNLDSNIKSEKDQKLLNVSSFNLDKIMDISVVIKTPPYFIVKTLLLISNDIQDISIKDIEKMIKENKDKIFSINHYLLYVKEFEYLSIYKNLNTVDIINIKL